MKPKMLMPYAASRVTAFPVAEALKEYFDVDVTYVYGQESPTPFMIDLPAQNEVIIYNADPNNYDILFGYDPGTLKFLLEAKAMGKKVGCTILDIPYHVFYKNRNYSAGLTARWQIWMKQYAEMDFIVSWREYTENLFSVPHLTVFAPTRPPASVPVNKLEYQVCYSGIVRPDKGVHNILEAVSLMEPPPKFVVVGGGYDLSRMAEYLKVDYSQVQCSETQKYEIYSKSMITSYSDSEWIPPLSPMEAISIGKVPIVADGRESRRLYKNHAFYVQPNSPIKLAETLKFYYENEPSGKEGKIFWEQNRSYDVYASMVNDFLKDKL